jgi:hypothetical protein
MSRARVFEFLGGWIVGKKSVDDGMRCKVSRHAFSPCASLVPALKPTVHLSVIGFPISLRG